ncbi:GxxExxY protein [Pedobacter sp.]|uniref:GxxExxY protein n=1 Tax=Pedobacter sp. TaxID=1411316 RepID=UPI003BA96F06
MITKTYLDHLEYQVTGACIEVHRALGPGLLESIYHECLVTELKSRNIDFISEYQIPLFYKGLPLSAKFRADLLIENCMIVELKAVEQIIPIHEAQILSYMKLLKIPKGLLINFNSVNIVKYGKRSFINDFFPLEVEEDM